MLDKLLTLTLDLNRLDAGTKARVTKILKKAEQELITKLNSDGDLTDYNLRRTSTLLREAQALLNNYYGRLDTQLLEVLEPVADTVATNTAKALNNKIPISMEVALPPEDFIKALASDKIIFGSSATEWWGKQAADVAFRFKGAVRQGMILGETNSQIVRRVKQVMTIATRNARTLVQTSVASVANNARQRVFEKNDDLIKGYKWITALDSLVCPLCMARSDKEWTFDQKPIGHSIGFSVPGIYFNDRCVLTAITKYFKELGFPNIVEPKPGQRASIYGPVSDKTTFKSFLDSKSTEWQNEALGKGRAELYRSGIITLENLINGEGRPLTVQQRKAKYS